MQGQPEGTVGPPAAAWWHRRPRWQLVLGLTFLAYLTFRVGQGALWLIEHA